jgi:hypothetical protein
MTKAKKQRKAVAQKFYSSVGTVDHWKTPGRPGSFTVYCRMVFEEGKGEVVVALSLNKEEYRRWSNWEKATDGDSHLKIFDQCEKAYAIARKDAD